MCQTFRGMATAGKKNRRRGIVLSEARIKQEEIRSVEKRLEKRGYLGIYIGLTNG